MLSPFGANLAPVTVLATASSADYIGNGAGTVFPTIFQFLKNANVSVYVSNVLKTEGVDYILTGAGDVGGGTVTFTVAPAAAAVVHLVRNTPALQEVDLRPEGPYEADTVEGMSDKSTLEIQELVRRVVALEALGATLTTSVSASIVYADVTFLTNANDIEDGFPLNVAVASGSTATGAWAARLRNLDDAAEVFNEPPAIQWAPGAGNTISLKRCSGLKPATNYTLRVAVVIP